MSKKLEQLLSAILVLAISINFVLYSSQSYSPPRAESISYSIVNCPTHEGERHETNIIQTILGTDSEHSSAKNCYCYDCCNQRVSFDITVKTVLLVLEKYSISIETISESRYVEDSYKNLPIRSPPNILA
ncbi:MAG: hypothetical protein DHS20C13_16660 [Thermodesulfobacteriota bacterium]|nr:MAG: hypothetical protein DHS20C13_16660 [Thermodesulfobacteriota bacterium]